MKKVGELFYNYLLTDEICDKETLKHYQKEIYGFETFEEVEKFLVEAWGWETYPLLRHLIKILTWIHNQQMIWVKERFISIRNRAEDVADSIVVIDNG